MTAPARAYFVDGVQLVGVDGPCEACELRPAVGRSISGHRICKRCAGWAAREAEELAQEKEESARRRAVERENRKPFSIATTTTLRRRNVEQRPNYPCGHPRTTENTCPRKDGRRFCRACNQRRSAESKARARRREQERMGFGADGRKRRAS